MAPELAALFYFCDSQRNVLGLSLRTHPGTSGSHLRVSVRSTSRSLWALPQFIFSSLLKRLPGALTAQHHRGERPSSPQRFRFRLTADGAAQFPSSQLVCRNPSLYKWGYLCISGLSICRVSPTTYSRQTSRRNSWATSYCH